MEFVFKKNFLGHMVLYVKRRVPSGFPGSWDIVYVKADEVDAAQIMRNLTARACEQETPRVPPGDE